MTYNDKGRPKLGIIGSGVTGSHVADVCRKLFDIYFFDIVPEKAKAAADEIGGVVVPSAEEVITESNLTTFAVPTSVVDAEMRRLIPYAKRGSCITDVTSVKVMPMKAMAESVNNGVDYFGMHPNYRATTSPYGQSVVICPGIPECGDRYQKMVEIAFRKKGASITYMSPSEADLYSDLNQNLVHDAYYGVMGVLAELMASGMLDKEKLMATATPTSRRFFESAGRMLGGKAHVYSGIQLSKASSPEIVEKMIESLQGFEATLFGAGVTPEEAQRGFERHFSSMRSVLGESFVAEACATTDQQYEAPGGIEIFYELFGGVEDKFMESMGAKTLRTYNENITTTSIPSGALNRVGRKYALARARTYKPEAAKNRGVTAFYCDNRQLNPGKKGIRFTSGILLDPDELRGLSQDEIAARVLDRISAGDKMDPHYDRVQMFRRYDDPILCFFDTVRGGGRENVSSMGPWVVSRYPDD